MLVNTNNIPSHVKFVSYNGKYPNFCSGTLTLEIDNEIVRFGNDKPFGRFWTSGGGLKPNYEGTYKREWIVDAEKIPGQYRKYANEIDRVFNENVEWGCCGGCI